MADDYKQRIENAKIEITEAEKKYLDVYFDRVKDLYVNGDITVRTAIQNKL